MIVEKPVTDQPTPAMPLPVPLAYVSDSEGAMPARPGGTATGSVNESSPLGVTSHDDGR